MSIESAIPLYGATLIRNGLTYDYPFQECFHSLAGISQEVWIALGDSNDGTEAAVSAHPANAKFQVVPTKWDEALRKSGLILSQQTNLILAALREKRKKGWVIYLQADEIISDHDYAQLLLDISDAEAQGCDAISFRYLHFWHSYERIAFAPRWYAHEIRACRLDRAITSFGDAQSLQGFQKLFWSDVPVFHYGHIRDEAAYARKQKDFHRWWHSDEEMVKVWNKGNSRDKSEPWLRYLGPQASFMAERIRRQGKPEPRFPNDQLLTIFGEENAWSESFRRRIQHPKIEWTGDLARLRSLPSERVALLQEMSFYEKCSTLFQHRSKVPQGMLRKGAKPWPKDFWALMRLSEKGIALGP